MPQSSIPLWQPGLTTASAGVDPRWECFSVGNTNNSGDAIPNFLVADADRSCHIPTSVEKYCMCFHLPVLIMELSNY
jgi:hypothetical protein